MASATPVPARSIRVAPASPRSIVARSSRRISSDVTSLTTGATSAASRPIAGFGLQVLLQTLAVNRVARDAREQVRIGGDERQVEQLGIRLLLQVDAFLLVALKRNGLLDRVERSAGGEPVVEHVVDVDVELVVDPARALGRLMHLDLRRFHLAFWHGCLRGSACAPRATPRPS